MAKKSGYKGYKSSFETEQHFADELIMPEVVDVNNNLPEPVMNVDSLFGLAKFLDDNKNVTGFPKVTVIPDVLKKKMYNNTITREEREHYMELLKFRQNSVLQIVNIIPQLTSKII